MSRILITGATGNVGIALIRSLYQTNCDHTVIAGVRNIDKAQKMMQNDKLQYIRFDFESPETFDTAFRETDILFLLRPPHISDVKRYFEPLLLSAQKNGIKKIVFLSVQGVEKSSIIPHHKIEKIILQLGFDYVFLRPSYFMQNLTTTLKDDIINKNAIVLPAGKALFNWIDIVDIGRFAAVAINKFDQYKNNAFDITGSENIIFAEACNMLSNTLNRKIKFVSPNLLKYYFDKRKEGIEKGQILVMIMLHYLARFQKPPMISDNVNRVTGQSPIRLIDFIKREKEIFELTH